MNKIISMLLIGVFMLLPSCNQSSKKWQKLHRTIENLIENSGGTVAVAFQDLNEAVENLISTERIRKDK